MASIVMWFPATAASAEPSENIWLRTTNYQPRFITNVIQVSIPTNTFLDEYHTNWVRQRITNVVDIYRTNLLTAFRTNIVPVAEYSTNVQVAYTTNFKTLTLTNWETVLFMRTNWVSVPVTNIVDFTNTVVARHTLTNEIVAYETNLVRAWQTNLKVISLTNWETVLVMKTNWVNVPLTNLVEIEVPATQFATPATARAPASTQPGTAAAPVASPVDLNAHLDFELTHTGLPLKGGQHPVRLVLRPTDGSDAILPVQEWRVEKVDGGALMVGSRPEFSGTLPAGHYRVTVRLRAPDGALRSLRCQLEVKPDGSAQRSSALLVAR